MNSSHNGKYFMISYAISEARFNDIDDLAKTYDLSRYIRPRCVTQEAIITFKVTMQLLDDCGDIDSSFNDLLLTFTCIDHTRGWPCREHKILLFFQNCFHDFYPILK